MSDHERSTSIPGLVRGQLCYLQIPAADVVASARFYERVFGWRVDPPESGFEAPELIGQWITDRPPSSVAGLVAWILVDDIRRVLADAEIAGAVLRDGPTADGPRELASFLDPAGNLIGIVQPASAFSGGGGPQPRVRNRTMPPTSVMPVLVYCDLPAAIEWLCAAFSFTERWHADAHRAILEFDRGAVMLGEAAKDGTTDCSASNPRGEAGVLVRVPDVDSHCRRAREHGAQVTDGPRGFPYGERQYNAVDIGGYVWTFSQSVEDVAPEEWGGTSGPGLSG